jgi:hypothetical protein
MKLVFNHAGSSYKRLGCETFVFLGTGPPFTEGMQEHVKKGNMILIKKPINKFAVLPAVFWFSLKGSQIQEV